MVSKTLCSGLLRFTPWEMTRVGSSNLTVSRMWLEQLDLITEVDRLLGVSSYTAEHSRRFAIA
jgi:hypothetical protein